MSTEELTADRPAAHAAAVTEAEARAAFLSRAGGPAVGARTVLERAPELLPGVVDAATTDIEAVLGHLAARAATHPAAAGPAGSAEPTAWGLDLATGGLRRVRVAGSGSPVGVAAGLTWVGALEEGLAQHCAALLARRLEAPGTRVPRLRLGGGGVEVPRALLRDVHAEGEPVAHDLTELLSLPACAVALAPRPGGDGREGECETVIATGATLAEAARGAVERALSRRRAHEAGRPVPRAFPAVGRERESDAPGPAPCAQWSRPLDALHSEGHSPVAVLLDHDARVNEVLPYLVRIVLSAK
ncbi:hypothetical protein ACIBEA_00955 [Streptomyces sp. NPDC051555]|uniref:hypothetical protein n=1 Tax=Streptomyces sp. NPDC051555 TaxID=3365657 RepID=UPI0037A389D4